MYVIITLLLISLLIYTYLKNKYSYWTNLGIKQGEQNLLFGSLADYFLGKKSVAEIILENCQKFKDERYFGMYQLTKPVLVINDPDIIDNITDSQSRFILGHMNNSKEDVDFYWSKAMYALEGEQWHTMHRILKRVLRDCRMQSMYPLMDEVAKIFVSSLLKEDQQIVSVEMKEIFSKVTNDMLTSCVLGVQTDSQKEPENDFYVMAKKTFAFTGLRKFIFFTFNWAPRLTKWLGLKFFPDDFSGFIKDVVRRTIKMQEDEGIVRPDVVHLLTKARFGNLSDEGDGPNMIRITILPDEDMMAQIMFFYFGGYNTSSFLMHMIAYELMVNRNVQKKLRGEIDEAFKKNNNELTSQVVIDDMPYLDMVIFETLRKWPIVSYLDRRCNDDYFIKRNRSGNSWVHLKDGDYVWIPVIGIHRDPKNYPDPERFIPERFSNFDNERAIYMPFGRGPRCCKGAIFAFLQTKTIFAHLLHKFELIPVEESKIPLVMDKTQSLISCKDGMWVGLKRRV